VKFLNLTANFASRTSQDAVDGLSDESDGESSTNKKRAPRRGRKKATTEISGGEGEGNQIITEETAAGETKEVKRRGRKKGKCAYWLHFCSTSVSLCCSFHDFSLLGTLATSKSQIFSVLLQLLLLQAQRRRRIRPRNRRKGEGEKLRL